MTTRLETSIKSKRPHLTADQMERLAYLSGELAEAQQAVAKILRHGYSSYDPTNPNVVIDRDGGAHPDNQADLETELGHVMAGINMMVNGSDLINMNIYAAKKKKMDTVKKWMHHQLDYIFKNFGD